VCGICGYVDRDPTGERLRVMCDALRHRGPDGEGAYVGPDAALGHRRLSIIDLATGQQPLSTADGVLQLVVNGEIYNYQQLRRDLEREGCAFRTKSDCETILHLYAREGERCVRHLRGMFAFALWDTRRRRLFAARDRLGQKPFYYVDRGDRLWFASEIKALLAADPSLAEPDLAALDEYYSLRLVAAPRTMFRRIRKLPPAHYLTFDRERGLRVERYWDVSFEPKLEAGEDALLEELEQRLVESIRLHLVSDVPVGAFLSGGLDSTLVVALTMHHRLADDFQTFSVGIPYGDFDEAPAARLVAERYGTRHHEEVIRPSFLDSFPRLVRHLDEPSDPLALCVDLIAQVARPHVKAVLGGDGGDELFGGYDRYLGNRLAGRYARLPAGLRRHLIGPLLRHFPDGRWYKSVGHQLKWLHAISFYPGAERYLRSLSYFYFSEEAKTDLYGPGMREVAATFDPGAVMRQAFSRADARDPVDRMLYADYHARLPDHPVMIQDRMTMAHGLEARNPFMDHELAEFAARLPVEYKIRGRSLRYLQTRLAQRYLPAEVLARKKQGFSSALPYLLRDELDTLYQAFLTAPALARDGLLSGKAVADLLEAHRLGRADHGQRLWLLLNSEAWYRVFVLRESSGELAERIAFVAGHRAAA
jgi:asparagine synthase (glutamine-hydrolysing)